MTAHPGESLSAYVDGELAAEERAGIESHLGTCPVCRHELAGVRQAKAWIAGLPEVLPPFGFYERMLLDPQARRRRDRWPVRAGAVGLAAMASIWLAVLGVTGVVGDGSSGLPALNSLVTLHEDTARRGARRRVGRGPAPGGLARPTRRDRHLRPHGPGRPWIGAAGDLHRRPPDAVGLRAAPLRHRGIAAAGRPPAGLVRRSGRLAGAPGAQPGDGGPDRPQRAESWWGRSRRRRWWPRTSSLALPARRSWIASKGPARACWRRSGWADQPAAERPRNH